MSSLFPQVASSLTKPRPVPQLTSNGYLCRRKVTDLNMSSTFIAQDYGNVMALYYPDHTLKHLKITFIIRYNNIE